jgi:RecA-dependent nuclease
MIGPHKKPTQAEQDRIDRLRPMGCSACATLGIPNVNRLELHHLVQANKRLGHWYSIFLCCQHHRGMFWEELLLIIPERLQISLADGRKLWNQFYPTERQLWEVAQERLHLAKDWSESRILPRRIST